VLDENIHRAVEDADFYSISILKSGPKNNIANYRPIAKISNITKLFERIVAHKLSFLVKTYINTSQHCFVAGRSTTTNLAVFSNFCIQVIQLLIPASLPNL